MTEPTKLESALDELLAGKSTEEIAGPDGLLKQLTKALIERAMNAELNHHLGYEKHAPKGAAAVTTATIAPTSDKIGLPRSLLELHLSWFTILRSTSFSPAATCKVIELDFSSALTGAVRVTRVFEPSVRKCRSEKQRSGTIGPKKYPKVRTLEGGFLCRHAGHSSQ